MAEKELKETESPLGISETRYFDFDSLVLENGGHLAPVRIAYETYGILNEKKDNAILICHALSGDAHAAGISKESGLTGWWEFMIGPGRPFDSDKFFVICSNVIAGCKGSTGPGSINPKTQKPYCMDFPVVTIKDMVAAQRNLIDHLGIEKLLCVSGGSMGGMQALQWVYSYPDRVVSAIPIATTLRHSPQQIAFNEVGRRAIVLDPNWQGGNCYGDKIPANGLAIARMIGHITYMSDESMKEKFGRRVRDEQGYSYDLNTKFEVEQYLKSRSEKFVLRFDANSYIYITKAIDCFDLGDNKELIRHFSRLKTKFLVISYSHDWLYPSYQSKEIVKLMKYSWVDVSYCEVSSTYGHDAFLIKSSEQEHLVTHFLNNTYKRVRGWKIKP